MNTMPTEMPQTLLEAVRHFSDLDVCHEFMVRMKWPDGKVSCPKCGGEHVGHIKSRRMFQCKAKGCRKQFSAKVGTIFEDSPLGLDKWFVAVWTIANCKNGISSYEVARAIGVTQKSAWHMLHRVRLAMQTKSFMKKMSGEIESDETLVGGRAKNMHKKVRRQKKIGTGPLGKTIVHGMLERGTNGKCSKVRADVVENSRIPTLQGRIKENVEPGSAIYTDSLLSYRGLDAEYIHQFVDHTVEYVKGLVHVNGMENFWSLLKRCLKGTYVAVAPFHLSRYVDEEAFRFNERKENDYGRFLEVMTGTVGRRLQYAELTGAD